MRTRITPYVVPIFLGTLLHATLVCAQDVLIVVNGSVPVSQITETQLRDIFTGVRTRFDNGTRAIPVLLKVGPVHAVFLHRHVGDTPDEFRVRWRKAVFTGQGSMPKECGSEADLLKYVEATPGAIGYIGRMSGSSSVRLLTVAAR